MKFASLILIFSTISANEISTAIGQIFTGAMSATQANMYNTEAECYVAAVDVQVTLDSLVDNADTSLIQVVNIKI